MPGPAQGGGALDAVNLALDVEELDSGASADTVDKAATDVGGGVEGNLQANSVFEKVVLDDVTFAGATQVPQNPALLRYNANGYIVALWQAGSAASPSGLNISYSTDGGVTWVAPVQFAAFNGDFVPSAVLDQSTGNIHVCWAKRGRVIHDSTEDIWYKVLTWNGTNWTLGGTNFLLEAGTGTNGNRNVSLAADDNGFLVLAVYQEESDNDVFLRTFISNAAWDLTSRTTVNETEVVTDGNVEARPRLLNVDDVTNRKWLLAVEQGGTFRLFASESVLSASVHVLAFTHQHTYFETSTDEFDLAHTPNTALSGTAGVVQRDSNQVVFRTWVPDPLATPVLSSAIVVEGDVSNPCRYPAVMYDGDEFIAVYARQWGLTAPYEAEVLGDSPNAYWRLGEAAGSFVDSSGNGNSGTENGTMTRGVAGAITSDPNDAITLDGSTGYVSAINSSTLQPGDVFTIEAWIAKDVDGSDMTIVSKGANGFHLRVNSSNKLELLKENISSIVAQTGTLTGTAYHHVVVTKNGATVKLYVDKVDVTDTVTNATIANTSDDLNIGRRVAGAPREFWDGEIDEVAIYPVALTASQVTSHYDQGVSGETGEPNAPDKLQIIYQRSSNNGGTWGLSRFPLDTDSAGVRWGWFKLPETTLNWDMVAILYSDNVGTPYDVHFGKVAIEIARTVAETAAGADVPALVVPVTDAGAIAEALVAGEAIGPVSDTGTAAEVMSQDRPATDVGVIAETLGQEVVPDPQEVGVAAEEVGTERPVADAASASESPVAENEIALSDVGAGAEGTPMAIEQPVSDVGAGVTGFPAQTRSVADQVRAIESFTSAPPDIAASIFDEEEGHTEFVARLATGSWTSLSEQVFTTHRFQKVYYFRNVSGMDTILFRRRPTAFTGVSAEPTFRAWSQLERSTDLGITWASVLADCADVDFGPDGVGFAIAAGGDTRTHRVYKSTDQGATWVEVWNDTTISNSLHTPYQRIAVDPLDNNHVALVGNDAGDSQSAVVFAFSTDGFATAGTRREDPIGGFHLFRSMVLAGLSGGRWIWGLSPDSISDIRNKLFTTDDDGLVFTLRFDQRLQGANDVWRQVLYDLVARKLFICHTSTTGALLKSGDNGDTFVLIDVNFVQDPDTLTTTVTIDTEEAFGPAVQAMDYDAGTDELFLGTDHNRYPVMSAVAPVSSTVWTNLKSNLPAVVIPDGGTNSETRCSVEGLILIQGTGAVAISITDTAAATELVTTLFSVLETVVATDVIVETIREVLETGTATEALQVLLAVAEAPNAVEALVVINEVTDSATAAEVLTKAEELWLTVRLLMVKGTARLRMEGSTGPSVPGFPPDIPLN